MQSMNDAALFRCPRCVSDLVGRRCRQARRGGESKVAEIGPFALKQRDREFESISLRQRVTANRYPVVVSKRSLASGGATLRCRYPKLLNVQSGLLRAPFERDLDVPGQYCGFRTSPAFVPTAASSISHCCSLSRASICCRDRDCSAVRGLRAGWLPRSAAASALPHCSPWGGVG
jgi:hypothetical protein